MRVLSDQNFHCKLHRNGRKTRGAVFRTKVELRRRRKAKHRRRRWRTKRHELRSFGAGLVPMNRAGVESQWGPETSSKKKDKEPRNDRKEIQRRWQGRPEGWCKDVRPRRKLIWLRTSIRRVPGKLHASITKKTKGGNVSLCDRWKRSSKKFVELEPVRPRPTTTHRLASIREIFPDTRTQQRRTAKKVNDETKDRFNLNP